MDAVGATDSAQPAQPAPEAPVRESGPVEEDWDGVPPAEAEVPEPAAHQPTAGALHKLVALLVIVGLVALIVFLVLWGLAR